MQYTGISSTPQTPLESIMDLVLKSDNKSDRKRTRKIDFKELPSLTILEFARLKKEYEITKDIKPALLIKLNEMLRKKSYTVGELKLGEIYRSWRKNDILPAIIEAIRRGNGNAIAFLISYDINWLGVRWVLNLLNGKIEKKDTRFFIELGEALKEQKKYFKKVWKQKLFTPIKNKKSKELAKLIEEQAKDNTYNKVKKHKFNLAREDELCQSVDLAKEKETGIDFEREDIKPIWGKKESYLELLERRFCNINEEKVKAFFLTLLGFDKEDICPLIRRRSDTLKKWLGSKQFRKFKKENICSWLNQGIL